jgi:hypothetical protein
MHACHCHNNCLTRMGQINYILSKITCFLGMPPACVVKLLCICEFACFFLLKIGMLIGTNTILLVGKTSYIWGTFFRTQGNKCLTSVVDQIYSFVATTIRTYQEICIYPSTTRNQLFAECLGVCRVHSLGDSAKKKFAECL